MPDITININIGGKDQKISIPQDGKETEDNYFVIPDSIGYEVDGLSMGKKVSMALSVVVKKLDSDRIEFLIKSSQVLNKTKRL